MGAWPCSWMRSASSLVGLDDAQEENEDEENLLDQLSSLMSAIMKKHGDAAMPLVDALMPSMVPLLAPHRTAEERRVALCLLDDILEFSSAGAQQLLPAP